MIQRINIQNFGSFNGFDWHRRVTNDDGEIVEFKKLNILYGRNYSGKTTLSRLVRCLQTEDLPPKFDSPDFAIETTEGPIAPSGIGTHSKHIRVFNSDFVDEHLSFLRDDEDGQIEPFAVLGGDNTKITKEIRENEKRLGSVEAKTGLRHACAEKLAKSQKKSSEAKKAVEDKDAKLRKKANQEIKQSPHLYGGGANYDITNITADIAVIRKDKILPLTAEESDEIRGLLKQEPLPDPVTPPELDLKLAKYHTTATEILSREIRPTKAIQELLDDALLQAWAKQGIALHRDKRTACGFCGNPLPETLWEQLDSHFSKESTDLEDSINDLLKEISDEVEGSKSFYEGQKSEFYSAHQSKFEEIEKDLKALALRYRNALNSVADELRARQGDPFKIRKLPDLPAIEPEIAAVLESLSQLIEEHQAKTKGLSAEQASAKIKLRRSEVSSFIDDIDLDTIEKNIKLLKAEDETLRSDLVQVRKDVNEVEQKIEGLQKQLRDERRGAEKVNEYLTHYFGHGSLSLAAEEEESDGKKAVKFEIQRGKQKAYNLSDGECSLIAFCYFMAKLQDAESSGKDLIIYIDDPISSLDSNHVFFVYSLIESLIAKPVKESDGSKTYRYEQLFISTHNLEFLKFLKKLSKPKKKHEQFVVVRKEGGSEIEVMPGYLRNYVTEFHFLFDEICECLDPANASSSHHSFYNFGNNLRKFLEVFLFFKYPFSGDDSDGNKRLDKFFEGDGAARELVNRLTNEYSHLGAVIDRGVQPVDCEEISKVAIHLLERMKKDDPVQFADLLAAVNRTDPLGSDHSALVPT